ncbi:MAG: IS3 family transposase, partial [Rhodobacteraceae bacterium]|nr:IS3 family transposase [Paracoccaceae bacterium]
KATADFIKARSKFAVTQTPYTWPQPKSCQHHPKISCPAGAIHTWFENNGEGRCAECCKLPHPPIMSGTPLRVILIERQARAKSDADLCVKINAAWEDNRKLYGARKVWHVVLRDNEEVARCTVERLMRRLGLKGVLRGKKVVTTNPDSSQPCPDDKVNRVFKADRPNQLWVSDFTYVQTWSGTVYVAFVIDVFARRIVGWRVSTSMATQFVLDALEQAIWQRKTPDNKELIHHSDRGSQYLSSKYTERLIEVGIDPSVGTVGDSYEFIAGPRQRIE